MKVKMPQNFQTINALMQNKNNPQDLVNQIMSNLNQEQKQNLLSQAKNYGCPNELLSKLQNLK